MITLLRKKWQLTEKIKRITRELVTSSALFSALLDATKDGILVVDDTGTITDYNHQFLEIICLPEEAVRAGSINSIEKRIASNLNNPSENCLSNFTEMQPSSLRYHNGKIIEFYAAIKKINHQGRATIYFFRDITKQKQKEERLLHKATHDNLTGLADRSVLYEHAENAFEEAKRTHSIVAILFIDIDHFKKVNDEHDHQVGDQVLKIIANRLVEAVRDSDVVARIGGDEFVILITSVKDLDVVKTIGEKLLSKVASPIKIKNLYISVSISIGISIFDKDGNELELLISKADLANQTAKALGRSCIYFYTIAP